MCVHFKFRVRSQDLSQAPMPTRKHGQVAQFLGGFKTIFSVGCVYAAVKTTFLVAEDQFGYAPRLSFHHLKTAMFVVESTCIYF